jgi:hypothetical protein
MGGVESGPLRRLTSSAARSRLAFKPKTCFTIRALAGALPEPETFPARGESAYHLSQFRKRFRCLEVEGDCHATWDDDICDYAVRNNLPAPCKLDRLAGSAGRLDRCVRVSGHDLLGQQTVTGDLRIVPGARRDARYSGKPDGGAAGQWRGSRQRKVG